MAEKERMNIVIVGHVDHGKSTVIGRLMADAGALPDKKLKQIKDLCKKTSKSFEYAFLLDALGDERGQGITIDVARCFFSSKNRDYVILDAPGHKEFLKNMVTGAARAEAALLVIDAKEGVLENSRKHAYLLSMIGVKQVAVIVNKMDQVGYSEERFNSITRECTEFLNKLNISPLSFIPAVANMGENIVNVSANISWYKGKTVLETIDSLRKNERKTETPFRMFLQDVYKFTAWSDAKRVYVGRIDSGSLKVGDEVVFYPSMHKSKVKSFDSATDKKESAVEGESIAFELEDHIYVKRGSLCSKVDSTPPLTSREITTNIFWMGKEPFVKGKQYYLKIGTHKVEVELKAVNSIINAESLLKNSDATVINRYEVAECELTTKTKIPFDLVHQFHTTSRFVIVDNYEIAGGGIITSCKQDENPNIFKSQSNVTFNDRTIKNGHKPKVFWFTGLSASGKSTIAKELEKSLFDSGKQVYVLDGDNIRSGINSDLGFSETDREENIRRIAEIANLFYQAGMIVIVAAISPFKKDRDFARKLIGNDFVEVFVDTSLETCERRDPKGLYEKARAGKIPDFTGISSPYESPVNPEIVIKENEEDYLSHFF